MRAYVKPFVLWIWIGTVLMSVGGLFAAGDRRYFCKRGDRKMANSVLTYKGYVAKVEFDRERGLLYGTVQGSAMR